MNARLSRNEEEELRMELTPMSNHFHKKTTSGENAVSLRSSKVSQTDKIYYARHSAILRIMTFCIRTEIQWIK